MVMTNAISSFPIPRLGSNEQERVIIEDVVIDPLGTPVFSVVLHSYPSILKRNGHIVWGMGICRLFFRINNTLIVLSCVYRSVTTSLCDRVDSSNALPILDGVNMRGAFIIASGIDRSRVLAIIGDIGRISTFPSISSVDRRNDVAIFGDIFVMNDFA